MNKLLIILSMGFIFMSCASTPSTHFYTLELATTPPSNRPVKYPITISIENIRADEPYSDDRLIFRDSIYEIKFYHYHRWVTHPAKMITEKMVAQLKDSRLFQNVVRMPYHQSADYLLQGSVKALEEWDQGEQWFGRLELVFTLNELSTNKIIWEKEFTAQTPVTQRTPIGVVKALSTSLESCLNQLVAVLDQHFQQR
jgi:ABC-type uncharacterized transport system auxiliary subunit